MVRGLALAVLVAAELAGEPLLRTKAPAGLAGGVAVMGVTAPDEASCRALRAVSAKVLSFGLAGKLMVPGAVCSAAWKGGSLDEAFALRAGARGGEKPLLAVLVLDAGGVVRYQRAVAQTAEGVEAVGAELIRWEQGRAGFSGHCGHCHGDDGAGTFFQGVKTMAGITTRMSDARILEGGERFGAVPISTWSDAEVAALLLFMRGL